MKKHPKYGTKSQQHTNFVTAAKRSCFQYLFSVPISPVSVFSICSTSIFHSTSTFCFSVYPSQTATRIFTYVNLCEPSSVTTDLVPCLVPTATGSGVARLHGAHSTRGRAPPVQVYTGELSALIVLLSIANRAPNHLEIEQHSIAMYIHRITSLVRSPYASLPYM